MHHAAKAADEAQGRQRNNERPVNSSVDLTETRDLGVLAPVDYSIAIAEQQQGGKQPAKVRGFSAASGFDNAITSMKHWMDRKHHHKKGNQEDAYQMTEIRPSATNEKGKARLVRDRRRPFSFYDGDEGDFASRISKGNTPPVGRNRSWSDSEYQSPQKEASPLDTTGNIPPKHPRPSSMETIRPGMLDSSSYVHQRLPQSDVDDSGSVRCGVAMGPDDRLLHEVAPKTIMNSRGAACGNGSRPAIGPTLASIENLATRVQDCVRDSAITEPATLRGTAQPFGKTEGTGVPEHGKRATAKPKEKKGAKKGPQGHKPKR